MQRAGAEHLRERENSSQTSILRSLWLSNEQAWLSRFLPVAQPSARRLRSAQPWLRRGSAPAAAPAQPRLSPWLSPRLERASRAMAELSAYEQERAATKGKRRKRTANSEPRARA